MELVVKDFFSLGDFLVGEEELSGSGGSTHKRGVAVLVFFFFFCGEAGRRSALQSIWERRNPEFLVGLRRSECWVLFPWRFLFFYFRSLM